MLTVRWSCPVCGCPLSLTKRLQGKSKERISIPDPLHRASGTEKGCPADVWVIIESDGQDGQEEDEPCYIQVWQVVHPQKAIGRPQEEQK